MNSIEPSYVSCGADRLYTDQSFPGTKDIYNQIKRNGPAGRFVCELFPAYSYQRPLDINNLYGNPDFLEIISAKRELINRGKTGPASALFVLSNVIVRDRVIYIMVDGGYHVIYETYREIDRESSTLGTLDELKDGQVILDRDGPVFFLGSTGDFNYGHWISDDLSRLAAFWRVRDIHPNEHIVVAITAHGGLIDDVRKETIELILSTDRNFSVKLFARPLCVRFPSIYYASPTTYFGVLKSPDAMAQLTVSTIDSLSRHEVGAARKYLTANNRRLFIDRSPTLSRNLQNGTEVYEVLKGHGFEYHTLDGLSFKDQVSLFSQAGIVVGNMGAAMINTLFCLPGTPVLYLAPEGWDDPFYWDLASVMHHPHYAMYGRSCGAYFVDKFRLERAILEKAIGNIEIGHSTKFVKR